jgi:hypothetical protein
VAQRDAEGSVWFIWGNDCAFPRCNTVTFGWLQTSAWAELNSCWLFGQKDGQTWRTHMGMILHNLFHFKPRNCSSCHSLRHIYITCHTTGQLCQSTPRYTKFFLRCVPSESRKAYRWIHLAKESMVHANRKQSLSIGNILMKTVFYITNHGDERRAF